MLNRRFFRALFLAALMLPGASAWSATTFVAVAANFSKPMEEIAAEFQKATGHEAKLSFGSSGKFVAQIENGAPFEVFMAADQENAVKLQNARLAVADTRFTYALGKLVLWSAATGLVDDHGDVLGKGGFKHLALADPKLAPYGTAAIEVLKHLGLQEKLQPVLVQGENISQTYQFISTGNAELGFVALSQVIDNGKIANGSGWIVPEGHYAPIRQDAILLSKGADNPAAVALLQFLKGPEASTIILKYGYKLPGRT